MKKSVGPRQDYLPEILEMSSFVHGGKAEDGDLTFKSIRHKESTPTEEGEQSATHYINTKGIPIRFPRKDGIIVKGKLIEWNNPEDLVVVGADRGSLVTKKLSIAELLALNPSLEEDIERYNVSAESRNQLTSIFEDVSSRKIDNRKIDHGGNAETLEEAMHYFELPGGIEGVAATSVAGDRMIDKGKVNQDRWYVNARTNFVAVIDGMGGGERGSLAAQLVTESIADNEGDPQAAAESAKEALNSVSLIGNNDGACYLSARIEMGKPIDISQCGDVDLYHFAGNGDKKYEPGDQMHMGQDPQSAFEYIQTAAQRNWPASFLDEAIGKLAGKKADLKDIQRIRERILEGQIPYVEPENPLYGNLRRVVVNSLTKQTANVNNFRSKESVEEGDWILLMSDGVSDNFEDGEIEDLVKWAVAQNSTPEQATRILSAAVNNRMKLKAAKDTNSANKHFKLDNATVIVMRVKKQANQAERAVA